jgi:hypothetical protein
VSLEKALYASPLSSTFAGVHPLLTDAELWTVAPDHAYGLAAMVGVDLLMLAALLSRKVGTRALRYVSVAGVVKLALVVGDVLTAPQFRLSYQELANFLFSLWAYDLLGVSHVGIATSACAWSRKS